MEEPVLVVPPALLELLIERVAERVAPPSASEPWVGVADVARHLGCRRQRVYDLVSRRATSGIPHRKEGGRLLFRLSQIDSWIESGRASAC
ncbi:MAG TPA: helix-turn-helix domain-containing protein [Solirubrobacteraceae bacterium]|nr:helix-turn-helix domain-containing protein [Solirubrobacteraceae bacterium]